MYNLKEGTQESLEEETTEESESSALSPSSTDEETSSSESKSSLEICGVALRGPRKDDGESSQKELKEEEREKMLAKDLTTQEKEDFKVMLKKHTSLFISDYSEITGVTAV